MKFKELFTPDKAIFATIFKPEFPDQYAAIFGTTAPQVYDVLAVLKVGEKQLLSSVTEATYRDIISAVITVNADGWVKAANAMTAEYEALTPTKRETTRKESADENETSTDFTTDSKKAFNDTDFTPDTKGTTDGTKTRNNTVSITETITGIGENKDVTDILRKEFAFRLDKWRESIIFALVNEITKVIY